MRILFVGAVEFSEFCIGQMVQCGAHIIGVVTQDRPGINTDYVDLGKTAAVYGIPCYRIRKVSEPHVVELIRQLNPDVIFVLGFSQLVPKAILDLPPKGVIGCHSTLLPMGRGRHPLIWALVKGLEESGTTFLYLDDGVDSGDIIMQKRFTIELEDDARTLYEKDKACAAAIIRELLPLLERGIAPRVPQDRSSATYWPKRTYRDGIIDWSRPAIDIYNLIRALTRPYPGASTYLGRCEMKVWKVKPPVAVGERPGWVQPPPAAPGTVLSAEAREIVVATRDLPLAIVDHEFVDADFPTPLRIGSMLRNVRPEP